MSEGDRALDLWLAEHVMGYQRIESEMFVSWVLAADHSTRAPFGEHAGYPVDDDVPHYTGRDWPQLAEALREKGYRVDMAWFDHKPGYGALLRGRYKGLGERQIWQEEADTPGLALGRTAEQALGG